MSRHEMDLVADLLAHHAGRAQGISAKQLAAQAGTSPRELRKIISELRREGLAICAHPDTGYFIARTPEEITETCKFLRGRALHSLQLEAQLRRVPLPELLGQLRIPI